MARRKKEVCPAQPKPREIVFNQTLLASFKRFFENGIPFDQIAKALGYSPGMLGEYLDKGRVDHFASINSNESIFYRKFIEAETSFFETACRHLLHSKDWKSIVYLMRSRGYKDEFPPLDETLGKNTTLTKSENATFINATRVAEADAEELVIKELEKRGFQVTRPNSN